MGVFSSPISTCCIWLGFWIVGFAEILFAVLRLNYEYSDLYCNVDNPSDYCPYELMISLGFGVAGILKILGFAPKLASSKCFSCVMMLLHIAVFALAIVAVVGHFLVDGFSDLTTQGKITRLQWGNLLLINSVSYFNDEPVRLLPLFHRSV